MRQSCILQEKYWVTQSVYFRLVNTVALGVGISYGKILLCHGISQRSVDNNFLTIDYNNRKVYDCFNNIFTAFFVSLAQGITPITIDDKALPHKRDIYTLDLLRASISVASENSGSNLTTPSDSPPLLLLTSDYPNPPHTMNKYKTYDSKVEIGYCCRKHDDNRLYKKQVLLIHIL